ncbi:MAG: hypothetical protein AB1778_00780 [Candidatus Bipolaricaulota bacterium]
MIDKAWLRQEILAVLRRTPQTHVHAIENEIRGRAPGYERGDALSVHEVIWDLLIAGILAPGKNSLNLHLPFLHVTDFGSLCLDDGATAAQDPDGYVRRLQDSTGNRLPPIATESARDATAAFQRGLTRPAAVLLSRAAKDVLRDVARRAGDQPASVRRKSASEAAAACREKVSGLGTSADEGAEFEAHLSGLKATALLAETEAGEARTPSVDRDRVLGHLVLFSVQCRFIYDLVARRMEEGNAASGGGSA